MTIGLPAFTVYGMAKSGKPSAIRVNIGGPKVKDRMGRVWQAEKNYSPGTWGGVGNSGSDILSATGKIDGTEDQELFRTMRSGETLTYRFDVPNGNYTVRILFAETYWESNDAEQMAIQIQGIEVLRGFNIFSEVGANAACEKIFDAKVTKRRLDIELNGISFPMHSGGRASAIEVATKKKA